MIDDIMSRSIDEMTVLTFASRNTIDAAMWTCRDICCYGCEGLVDGSKNRMLEALHCRVRDGDKSGGTAGT